VNGFGDDICIGFAEAGFENIDVSFICFDATLLAGSFVATFGLTATVFLTGAALGLGSAFFALLLDSIC
jgi:hypothetical protein